MAGKKLKSLNLSKVNMTGIRFTDLKFPELEHLSLTCCTEWQEGHLLELLQMCGNKLQSLKITGIDPDHKMSARVEARITGRGCIKFLTT